MHDVEGGEPMNRRTLLRTIAAMPLIGRKALAGGAPREVGLPVSLGGKPVPTFQNGYLALFETDFRTIELVDATGWLAATFQLTVPEAASLAVRALAVSAQKTIVAAVSATDPDGRYASMLVSTDFKGNVTRVVRTTPFATSHLTFLSDGRLLCLGREYDAQFEDVPGHNILRFFSTDGVLQSSALSVDVLRPNKREPHPNTWYLAPGKDRVGLLDPIKLRYVEFDHTGAIVRPLSSLGIDPPDRVIGIALLSNGDRLVTVDHPKALGNNRYGYGGSLGLHKLKDSPSGVVRSNVTGITPPEGSKSLLVLGIHNDDVVFLSSAHRLVFASQPLD